MRPTKLTILWYQKDIFLQSQISEAVEVLIVLLIGKTKIREKVTKIQRSNPMRVKKWDTEKLSKNPGVPQQCQESFRNRFDIVHADGIILKCTCNSVGCPITCSMKEKKDDYATVGRDR